MVAEDHHSDPVSTHAGGFATTHWSVVLAAGQCTDARASVAWERLCSAYWYPLYACARRQGFSPEDAEDLTQAFFARLIEKDYIARADPQRGRFRSYLLTGLKHFLGDERDKVRCLKRGGGQSFLSFDAQSAEARYSLEPLDQLTPERVFERTWALTLLEHAANRLRDEYQADGRAELFAQLTEFRLDAPEQRPYAEVAAALDLSESAVKSAIRRLRERHHQLVREEILHTLADPAEVDDEIRHLLDVLGG